MIILAFSLFSFIRKACDLMIAIVNSMFAFLEISLAMRSTAPKLAFSHHPDVEIRTIFFILTFLWSLAHVLPLRLVGMGSRREQRRLMKFCISPGSGTCTDVARTRMSVFCSLG